MVSYAKRVKPFETTIFAEVNDWARKYQAVNLGQGRPDFDGPESIIEAAVQALRSGDANQYAPGLGIQPLRERIALHAASTYGITVDPHTEVVITSGASEGVFAAILGNVDPGDEVILIEPFFDTYLPAVQIAGGKPVYVPLRPPEWRMDPDELRATFNDNTRAIVINTPHNPTGRIFDSEELALIAELCQMHDAIVIADEVYEHLYYDNARHIPIATLPGMFERTLSVSSAAKTFSVTGWKVGWVYGARPLVEGTWRIRQNITFAVNHPAQYGIAHAFTLDNSYFATYRDEYAGKRQYLLNALIDAGFRIDTLPEGAFYIMANFSQLFDGNDIEFTKYLIEHIGVACIPPSGFFSEPHRHLGQNYVRFAYCKQDSVLEAAAERLAQLKG